MSDFPKIILGSKSPRRKQLLEDAGFDVTVISIDVPEDYPDTLKEDEIAEYLAIKKSEPLKENIQENELLITADSIVVLDGIVYGKPDDKNHATQILKTLSGKLHKVYTGVCICSSSKKISFTELSEIKFHDLTDDEIEYYLEKHQPYDKAGAYGIQDWIGLCKVEYIKGTFSNIMGLPVAKVYEQIDLEFIK